MLYNPNCFNLILSKWINTVRQIFVLSTQQGVFETVITSVRLREFFGFFRTISQYALWSCLITLSLNNQHCQNTCGSSAWKMHLCLFKHKTVLSHPLVTAVPIFFSLLSVCVDIILVCTSSCFIFAKPGRTWKQNQSWLSLVGYL